MHDDALKELWRSQNIEPAPPLPDEAQIAAMKMRMKGFDKTITGRDWVEVVACIFIIGWFGWDFHRAKLCLFSTCLAASWV